MLQIMNVSVGPRSAAMIFALGMWTIVDACMPNSMALSTLAPSAITANFGLPGMESTSTSSCEGPSNLCVGDVTHYDGGLGACGWSVDTDATLAVALPVDFMGYRSNDNPYCGRQVTLRNPTSGTVATAVVADKCMGCSARAIDCTNVLFDNITDGMGDGRVHEIQWWLSDRSEVK
jgi:hypothetical protein